ncbi:MAG: hypothetical protein ABEJ61_08300 [Haloferacaceae archaeon]
MDLPAVARDALGDEGVAARVPLGGEDLLLVTPTRTVVYRGEGLLSDESVEEFPHDAERIEVEEGRRKSTVRLDYGLDGERTLALPTKKLSDAFHPILAGVLNAAGVTDPGEAVTETFRFSELTVVVTSDRLVKHVGSVVWDEDYEEYHYDDVTDLSFEEGRHGTAVVLERDGRQERFKVPNESARLLRESLVDAVLAYHGYDSLAAFREARTEAADAGGGAEDGDDAAASTDDAMAFGTGLDPLDTGGENGTDVDPGADDDWSSGVDVVDAAAASDERDESEVDDDVPTASSGPGAAAAPGSTGDGGDGDAGDLAAEVATLREAVEEQNERIERQAELISTLIEELRRGR